MIWFLAALGILVGAVVVRMVAMRIAAARAPAPELGVEHGRLRPCPDAPNCVSSQAHPHDQDHYLPPLAFDGDPERVAEAIDEIVLDRPLTERVQREGRYLRYAFQTYLMRFTDDVEFWIDAEGQEIHFRSASRTGRDDMGTNRTRMRSVLAELKERLEDEGLAADD